MEYSNAVGSFLKNVFRPKFLLAWVIPLCLIVIAPFLGKYDLHILILASLYATSAMSWDIISGYTGQINFGLQALFGAGSYTAAFLVRYYNVSPGLCPFFGGAVAVLFGLMIGLPSLKLTGPYFTIVTLAFGEIMRLSVLALSRFTGGEEGISGIRPLTTNMLFEYYLSLVTMLISAFILYRLIKSHVGLIFKAIREDELVVKAVGINSVKYKILAFCICGFFAGISGSLYVFHQGIAEPTILSLEFLFIIIAMVVLGGTGTLIGPIGGAYIVTCLSEYFRAFKDYRLLIFTLLVILMLRFMPRGIVESLRARLIAA